MTLWSSFWFCMWLGGTGHRQLNILCSSFLPLCSCLALWKTSYVGFFFKPYFCWGQLKLLGIQLPAFTKGILTFLLLWLVLTAPPAFYDAAYTNKTFVGLLLYILYTPEGLMSQGVVFFVCVPSNWFCMPPHRHKVKECSSSWRWPLFSKGRRLCECWTAITITCVGSRTQKPLLALSPSTTVSTSSCT